MSWSPSRVGVLDVLDCLRLPLVIVDDVIRLRSVDLVSETTIVEAENIGNEVDGAFGVVRVGGEADEALEVSRAVGVTARRL